MSKFNSPIEALSALVDTFIEEGHIWTNEQRRTFDKAARTIEPSKRRIVNTGDSISWNEKEYGCVIADDVMFVLCAKEGSVTHYDEPAPAIFSNDKTIMILEELHMTILKKKA